MPELIAMLNGGASRSDLRELVRRTVKDMSGGLHEGQAGDLVGAGLHGRAVDRGACRAAHCDRSLFATPSEVTIRIGLTNRAMATVPARAVDGAESQCRRC